jgi:hypothetical protein
VLLLLPAAQMDQKHAVEDVLLDAGLPGLMLEATMFMEEFWKKYTRPGLLKGSFTFSLPGEDSATAGGSSGAGCLESAVLAWGGRACLAQPGHPMLGTTPAAMVSELLLLPLACSSFCSHLLVQGVTQVVLTNSAGHLFRGCAFVTVQVFGRRTPSCMQQFNCVCSSPGM